MLNNPNIQKMQLMMNYPSVQRMQQIFDNYPKINEFREKVYYSNLNIQMPIQIMDSQLQIIKNYSEVYSKTYNWNNIISSAIGAYNSTQEEEFEVVIENFPVIFLKPRLNEYIRIFQNLEIPENISVYLGFASYIFLWLAPYATFVPALEPVLLEVLKWIVEVLKSFGVIVLEYKTPKKFAELTFSIGTPAFISFIFRKLSKK
ncbi:hypothetical protein JMUB3936_1351 [Leptotrichia wadei]|uniref:Uncharacterized protein n=2 Tax=Leptotrichia wadei TaxID=157687 RepID=A0A510KUZ3_9FUSO|nr:hypothetical protein JMUB3936_1351 [Leptotrichia wadei]